MYRTTDDVRHHEAGARDGVLEAVRFSVGVALVAVVFLAAAAVWVGTCGGATFDTVACGAPQRTLLALGAPLILLAGGFRAFFRMYQTRRQHGIVWPWLGAAFFLLAAMLLVLANSAPSIAMP